VIGLDTNVLVRFIVRDDPRQAEAATRLIESRCTAETPGLVCCGQVKTDTGLSRFHPL